MILIGHRGCYYPSYNQNTLRCFEKVMKEGVPAIEFDVQLCGDGELVVVHNLDLSEVSTGKGQVSTTSSSVLKQLYAGDPQRGEDKIPFLLDVLEFFASASAVNRPVAHLELKGNQTGTPTGEMLNTFFEAGRLESNDFLISSFNWQELKNIRAVCPGIGIALLDGAIRRQEFVKTLPKGSEKYFEDVFAYGNEDYMLPRHATVEENRVVLDTYCSKDSEVYALLAEEITACLAGAYYNDALLDSANKLGAVSVNLWFQPLSKDFVEQAHAKGLAVLVYTVNKEADLLASAEMGVDGIFTDFYTHSKEVVADYL